MKLLKKIYTLVFKVPRILKIEKKIDQSILKKDYENAFKFMTELGIVYGERKNYNMYNLYNIHLMFLKKNYKSIFVNENIIENINSYNTQNLDQKKYQKLFVYNLMYLSYMLIDSEEEASLVKKIFHEINYDLDMRNVKEYLKTRYPVYNGKLLENLFKEDGYYQLYSEKKLSHILENDIFHVDGTFIDDEYFNSQVKG